MLDFKSIAQTPILDVLKMLGIELEETTADIRGEKVQQFIGTCPISKASNHSAFKVTPSRNRWFCFCATCKSQQRKGGDCIELVRWVRNIDLRSAAEQIQTLCGNQGAGKGASNPSPKQEVSSPSKDTTFDPLKYLSTLDPNHEALSHVGIDLATLIAAKAGYASKGLNRGRLAVWCEEIGCFIGIALTKDQEPMFVVPKGKTVPPLLDIIQAVWNAR